MSRGARQTLLWLTLLLVLIPLAMAKPGLPGSLKSDEPAYYMMARSLVSDGDLLYERRDIERLFDEFPYLPARNVILMTDDGWRTIYFGKPYVYSLFAAPFAGLFGSNGMVAFNMLLLMAMVAMGASYLRHFNPDGLAVAYSAGFFLLSSAFAYVFWIHPEVFNMASVAAALYFAFCPPQAAPAAGAGRLRRWLWSAGMRPVWSAALLAPGAYNKPMLALFALPALWVFFRRRGWRAALTWCTAALVAGGLICALSMALTGKASAYLGSVRKGWNIHTPDFRPPLMAVEGAVSQQDQGSWWWILAPPTGLDLGELTENAGNFLWGRHTGLFVYMPFALLSLLLFLGHERRSRARWLLLAALAGVAAFFLLWIPFNWHGGGGFVGNRYFVTAYPGFLFLVTRVAPAWITGVGYAAGGLILGSILFTPWGAPVFRPTLQAHVRQYPFRLFPYEFSMRDKIPGYWGSLQPGAWFYGRRDVFEVNGEEMWFHGRTSVKVWMFTREPVEEAAFRVRNLAPDNSVTLRLPGSEQVLEFDEAPAVRRVVLRPTRPSRTRWERERPPRHSQHVPYEEWPRRLIYIYDLEVETTRGQNALANDEDTAEFYLGASLAYLGTADDADAEVYGVEWLECSFPESVGADELFTGTVRLRNTSSATWPSGDLGRLKLAYHWLTPEGETVVYDGRRTSLGVELAPGGEVEVQQLVTRPEDPGRYRLEVDLIYEFVSWFSQRGAPTCEAEVEVRGRLADDGG